MADIKIGKVVNTRGIHGEIKVFSYVNTNDLFGRIKSITINGFEYSVTGVKYIKKCVALKLHGIDNPDTAETLVGFDVFTDENRLPELEAGAFYVKDIIGSAVFENNSLLGTVTNVYFTGANDVYEIIDSSGKTALIPSVKEFIKHIDIKNKRIDVELIDGMRPE